jgi:transcription-repair coupling factor (superfamily II helicase)
MRNVKRMSFLNFDSSFQRALEKKHLCVTSADNLVSTALLISQSLVAQKAPQHLVITKDLASAQKLSAYLDLFAGFLSSEEKKSYLLQPHDISPYSGLYSSRSGMLQRLRWLYHASLPEPGSVFIAPIKALAQLTLPQDLLLSSVQFYKKGDLIPDGWALTLASLGYQSVPLVEDPGTFSIRGGIIDIFSPAHETPVRIELFGDQIESLRWFQPQTQSSIGETNDFVLIPAHEILFSDERILNCCKKIDGRASETDVSFIQSQIRNQTYFDGIEFLTPYFYSAPSYAVDYLPKSTLLWIPDALAADAQMTTDLLQLHEEYSQYKTHLPAPDELYCSLPQLFEKIPPTRIDLETLDTGESDDKVVIDFASRNIAPAKTNTFSEKVELLIKKVQEWKAGRAHVFLCGSSETQYKRLLNAFQEENLHINWVDKKTDLVLLRNEQAQNKIHFLHHSFDTSFQSLSEAFVFVGVEHFLKKSEGRSSSIKTSMSQAEALSFSELREGDPVVHSQHGVALYMGLKVMNIGGIEAEFLELKFKDNDKLFLPIYRLSQVHKYAGAGAHYILDKLGGKQWEKTKAKVQTRLREMANELVQLYAKRMTLTRSPYDVSTLEMAQFEEAFAYEETIDQLKALEDIKKDFAQARPMDRLICGDVGFGKTEVAMRAAFLAASQKRQVAVLAPTTILTFQHMETFKKRFSSWPLKIAVLNRFISSSDAQNTLKELKEGKIDILIGTHRLLSNDVQFSNLGLLIVDEEQKFGVKHKEKIRYIKNTVDTLSMSATPIPRTLNMSLLGLRDLSLINTPPNDRLPTRTFVSKFDMSVIKKNVLAEIKRGGQIFFLHNRVQSIYALADELRENLPAVKMAVAHGQMEEHELEKTIVSFFNKEIDMLVCTTIIESGMDIPNANTMFVDQAQALGLSQLYQLRGRVGRGKQRAFCYLLIPRSGSIDDVAKERLRILQQNSTLGSGIQIAQYDLELRGAGTLLGEEQSGAVDAVGYELYMDLLEMAVQEAKGQPLEEAIEPEINLKMKALFPHSYMPDIRLRLSYYKALSNIQSADDIDQIERNLRDQFGQPPEEVFNLMGIMMIRLLCKKLGIRDVSSGINTISLFFTEQTKLPPQKVIELTSQANKKYSLTPDNRLKIRMNEITWQKVYSELEYLQKLC